jgi:site-specific DNA-methyltransferase (adenine-specific)
MKFMKVEDNVKNPDVLNCLANLSNDQVFTPTKIAKRIFDEFPENLWSNPDIKVLDPVCKTGIFLREAAQRFNEGLKNKIKNDKKRIEHILKNQIYGIATTEIASLIARRSVYYSKNANGKYSACKSFNDTSGNIIFNNAEHEWKNQNCKFCGASKNVWERDDSLEKYSSEFIHTDKPDLLFPNMKFDVIIGNPPYQLSDGGHSRSASTIYHLFIENAKKLNPRYLSMIIPSRWFVGGKGLEDFRSEMLKDRRIRKIVDFENSNEAFPGQDIPGGVNYFLWDKDYSGKCEFVSVRGEKESSVIRFLDEYEILVRDAKAIPFLKKIEKININNNIKLNSFISPRKSFSLPTNYNPKKSGVPCWFIQKIGLQCKQI